MLTELSIPEKIHLLHDAYQFELAIKVLSSYPALLQETHFAFANHLYSIQKFKEALDHFILSSASPPSIIHKYVSTTQCTHLITYILHLYKNSQATTHHVTLLISCFITLDDLERCEAFIAQIDKNTSIDINKCARLCITSGWYKQAKDMAINTQKHDLSIEILVRYMKDYAGALEYTKNMTLKNEMIPVFKSWGDLFLNVFPEKFVQLLQATFTLLEDLKSVTELVPIFINKQEWAVKFFGQYVRCIFDFMDNQEISEEMEKHLTMIVHHLFFLLLLLERKDEAIDLLANKHSIYFGYSILVICEEMQFFRGTEYVYVENGMHEELIELYKPNKSFLKIFTHLEQIPYKSNHSFV